MTAGGRRYDTEEVRRIFAEAAEADRADDPLPGASLPEAYSAEDGLTLSELQSIGREVGLPAELVARAAAGVDSGPSGSGAGAVTLVRGRKRQLGVPIGVGYQEELPGPLSDAAWDRLVVEMREVFQATGTSTRDGSLRQWRNGNLRIFVEPTAGGTRIRMQTVSDRMRGRVGGGVGLVFAGAALSALVLLGGEAARVAVPGVLMALGGLGLFGSAVVSAPEWSELREQQMRRIAARANEFARSEAGPASTDAGE